MNRQQVFDYVKKRYGTEADYPWADRNAVLRHKENNKWYGVILEVQRGRIGLSGDRAEDLIDLLNVKCEPMLIGSLRTREGFFPAYHMNKDKWISIRLEDGIRPEDGICPEDGASEDEIKNLIDLSFEMTGPRKKGKKGENGVS